MMMIRLCLVPKTQQVLRWMVATDGPSSVPAEVHLADVAAGFNLPVEDLAIRDLALAQDETSATWAVRLQQVSVDVEGVRFAVLAAPPAPAPDPEMEAARKAAITDRQIGDVAGLAVLAGAFAAVHHVTGAAPSAPQRQAIRDLVKTYLQALL